MELKKADKFEQLFTLGLDEISEFIAPKNTLLTNCKLHKCVELIHSEIIAYPNYTGLKTNIELLKVITNLVENLIEKEDKLDKEQICCDVYKRLFNLTEPEIVILKHHIKFLCDNKLVKRISRQKKLRKWLWQLVSAFFRQ